MKITRKNLEKLIEEEVEKVISEYESTTLRHPEQSGYSGRLAPTAGSPKTSGRGLSARGHVDVLEEILDRLSRIEGKIDAAAGVAPMSSPS